MATSASTAAALTVSPPGSWATLPKDIADRVVTGLRNDGCFEALRHLRLVNKNWSACVSLHTTRLKLKDLEREDFPRFLRRLKEVFGNVQSLDVPVVWMDDDCCRLLADQVPTLRSIELFWGDSISDAGLLELAKLPLRSLKVYHSRLLTDTSIDALTTTSLEELWLYGANQVTDEGFRKLEELKTLTTLRLMYCNRLSRYGLEPLFTRDGLQIFVRFCRRISSEISIS